MTVVAVLDENEDGKSTTNFVSIDFFTLNSRLLHTLDNNEYNLKPEPIFE